MKTTLAPVVVLMIALTGCTQTSKQPPVQEAVAQTGALATFMVGKDGQVTVMDKEGRQVPACAAREKGSDPCTIALEEKDGKLVPVDPKTREPLQVRHSTKIQHWRVGEDSCEIYWTISGVWEVCY